MSVAMGFGVLNSLSDEVLSRGNQVVLLLQDLIKCDAIALTAIDPFLRTDAHRVVAGAGYSNEIMGQILTSFSSDKPGYSLVQEHSPSAFRWRDLALTWNLDFASTSFASRLLIPAGFHEGLSLFLRLSANQNVGAIHVSWEKASAATVEKRDIVEKFHSLLANSTNLLQPFDVLARQTHPDFHVAVVDSNRLSPVPGRCMGQVLSDPSFLSTGITSISSNEVKQYIYLDKTRSSHRILLMPCTNNRVLVTETRIEIPYGLSPRELEVVTYLIEGMSNSSIAVRLSVSPRTVATHVENILVKMNCTSRTQVAVRATEQGIRLLSSKSSLSRHQI